MSVSHTTNESVVRPELHRRLPEHPPAIGISAYLDRLIPLLIFLVSLFYLSLFRRYSVIDPDEGVVLQGAERILRGEVPYRDFFMFYTPGSMYIVAALFKIFGDSLIVARTSIAVVGAGCSVIAYLLARRVCSREF